MSEQQEKNKRNQFVFGYDPSEIPLWVWAIVLGLIFLLFVVGIYYASRGAASGPQISTRQVELGGGILGTPGAF